MSYTRAVTEQAPAVQKRFEAERRRSAFIALLAGGGAGIIAADMWIAPWLGIPGGIVAGLCAFGIVYTYESVMWRRHHGR